MEQSRASEVLSRRVSHLVDYLYPLLEASPYSIPVRLEIAKTYQDLGYPDLAAGDAYRALLLIDEVKEEGEYYDQASDSARNDAGTDYGPDASAKLLSEVERLDHRDCCSKDCFPLSGVSLEETTEKALTCWSRIAYTTLIGSLIDCRCWRSAFECNVRALKTFPDPGMFGSFKAQLMEKLRSHFESEGRRLEDIDIDEYPDKGLVRRELYPWNEHEPNRYSPETLEFLNEEMVAVAPKLEVRVTELPMLTTTTSTGANDMDAAPGPGSGVVKQLGVFAREDLAPENLILEEKSILTAVARLHDSFCDCCSASLPKMTDAPSSGENAPIIACEDCDEAFFCSSECEELAKKYHPALCGVSNEFERVPAKEAADSLYSLLLIRALAMAETQDVHPLDLKEVRYIWGDYHGLEVAKAWKSDSRGWPQDPFAGIPQTLPFSFNANILKPLHMLEKMGVNIFEQSHRYDFWVFNTLYAKFRGTASARQGLDGRPEVGAVHPLWCLANHSCEPNVRWEWQGSMRFWARKELVRWGGRPETDRAGIRKGEEILGHYCDVGLPVKERREWAVGALGGNCMCRRCMWEESVEDRRTEAL